MRVLNVAEKPSVAREVSNILSNGHRTDIISCARFNKNFQFDYGLNGQNCTMIFTSVTGHLMELDFTASHRSWGSCTPSDLYSAPLVKRVPDDKGDTERNLANQARSCDMLILWLDCDREGENIAFEVINVCLSANATLVVKRAWFSALIPRDIHRAVNNLREPNFNHASAVDARQEIDLRVGCSFTRYQTLLLQILAYRDIKEHCTEAFWYIHVTYATDSPEKKTNKSKNDSFCEFKWKRGRLFDHFTAAALYGICLEAPLATVTKVDGKEKRRWAPYPLSTLEMQKKGTQSLRIPGERIMRYAEELYQAGFISYPRTETDRFPNGLDLLAIVQEHVHDPNWGSHAQNIIDGSMWKPPRAGKNDDQAHPPIHPTKYGAEPSWNDEKKRLYEFIVRSFLACCSKDALGHETVIEIDIAGEQFSTTGLMILERNWLDVYPYASWGGNENLPQLHCGQKFLPHELTLKQGNTQPPHRLSERDLIAKMEEYGIGTDATVAEHIQKQLDRGYAEKTHQLQFIPTPVGEGLILAYSRMQLDGLWKPQLRGRIEDGIRDVAEGRKTKDQVLNEALVTFKQDFMASQSQSGTMISAMEHFFPRSNADSTDQNSPPGSQIGPCNKCGSALSLHPEGNRFRVKCMGNPVCNFGIHFPLGITSAVVDAGQCPRCTHGSVHLMKFTFRLSSLPTDVQRMLEGPEHSGCVVCDPVIDQFLQSNSATREAGGRTAGVGGGRGGGHSNPHTQAPPRRARVPGGIPGQRGRATNDNGRGRGRTAARRGGTGTARGRRPHGGGAAAVAAQDTLPTCPLHELPVWSGTARTPANDGRVFYKCSDDEERDDCLPFVWADEWDNLGFIQPGSRGGNSSARGRSRGRGGRGRRGRSRGRATWSRAGARTAGRISAGGRTGQFANATGAVVGACYTCGQPGHWSSNCPDNQ